MNLNEGPYPKIVVPLSKSGFDLLKKCHFHEIFKYENNFKIIKLTYQDLDLLEDLFKLININYDKFIYEYETDFIIDLKDLKALLIDLNLYNNKVLDNQSKYYIVEIINCVNIAIKYKTGLYFLF